MDEKAQNKRIRRLWVFSVATMLVGQAVIAAALFIPQNRVLKSLVLQDAAADEALLGHARSAELLRETNASLELAAAELASINLPGQRPPPEAILDAVAQAKAGRLVEIVSFTRPHGVGPQVPPDEFPVWNLQFRAPFAEAVRFLHQVEREGVLLATLGFQMRAGQGEDSVLMQVALVSHTEKTIQADLAALKAGERRGGGR